MDIQLGRELFMFDGFNHWCDTAQEKFKAANVTSSKVLCIDAKGRVCAWGAHFMEAAKDGAYPVRAYLLRDDMAPMIDPDKEREARRLLESAGIETPNAIAQGREHSERPVGAEG